MRLLTLLFLGSIATWAQTGTATLSGSVSDQTSAAIAGATAALTNEETGLRVETLTNDVGVYRFASLTPGRYRLDVTKPSFRAAIFSGITVSVAQALSFDVSLQLGETATTITVEAAAAMTESQTSTLSQLVDRKAVAGLPMPNRAATSLASLAPGVVMIDTGQGAENYPVFSVAGGRARNQNFTLDGVNVTNAVGLTRPQQMTSLPMDAMQEFRVITNSYGAEYGHSTGGVIALSTRSGSNQFRGSIFEYARHHALDARNFFASAKPPLRLNQFGGAIGGPIRKDRTHFFASWEGSLQLSSVTSLQTVPDEAQRAGDFSGLVNSAGKPFAIYDPLTTVGADRQPFAGNRIPASRLDPVGVAAASYYALPNRQGTITGANNFGGNNNSTLRRNIVVGRVDHQLSERDYLTGRYYINDSFIDNRGAWGLTESDPDANTNDARIQSVMAGYTRTIRPSLINEFKFSFLQRKFIDQRAGAGEDLASRIGLKGVSSAAFPNFIVPGYSSLSGNVSRIQTPIRDTQFIDSVSYYHGKHAIKAGVEHRRGSNNELRDRSSAGSFSLTPLITGKPFVSGTGNALASLLIDEVNAASLNVSDQILSRAYYWAGYLQDDWRVTDRLTLNFGVRWESELPRRVDGDRQNSFDLAAINPVSGTPGVVTFSGRNGVARQAFNTDWNNFGPRIGLAWRLPFARETVVRAGAGFFYGPTVSNTIGDAATLGFSTSSSLVVPQGDFLSAMRLSDGYPQIARPPLDSSLGAVPLGQRPNTAVGFFERNRPTPVSYQYNLNVQRAVAANALIEAGYMANVSHHLTANDLSLNQVAPSLMGPGNAQARRPFPQFSNVFIINPAVGNSTYHAGFLKAEKRFSRGVSFLAHYTFSKFLDDVASSSEFGDVGSYMDAYNRSLDKGLSGTDVRHRFVLSALYETPSLRGPKWLNQAFGGWKLGAFATSQSGPPFTVTAAANTTNAFSAGPLRPDVVGDIAAGERTLSHWFNTSAFAAPRQFAFGNAPRSVLRGDSLENIDLALEKQFRLTERFALDARGEFYNALNHATFEMPGRVLGNADFGSVTAARPARTVQIGLRLSF